MFSRAALFSLLPALASALLQLPSVFSDGCILQTNHEYGARSFVYGTGEPGEAVLVSVSAAAPPHVAANYSTTADATGYFIVTLNPLAVGESFDIIVTGSTCEFGGAPQPAPLNAP